jgi:phenylalanyl-tRNA synthetase alpha chain
MSAAPVNVDELRREAEGALAAAADSEAIREWHGAYLGRKGRLTGMLRTIGQLSPAERAAAGQALNEVRKSLEAALEERQAAIEREELLAKSRTSDFDPTLPGRPVVAGRLHPTMRTIRQMVDILSQMGFQVFPSPEVETDEYNFGLLNMPPDHPARDMWDTFYTTKPGVILRTHTSPGQIHAMRRFAPEPIRVICAGKCYRYEMVSARSESMFYQLEGLAVGRSISFGDLKGVLLRFARQMFGATRELRFRKSYFPFTEPSVEVDVSCALCDGRGCGLCKYTGWLEVLGAGMVHPTVLANGNYDPAEFSGFAFGAGPDRLTMLKHRIDDIRYFFSNDVRLLEKLP